MQTKVSEYTRSAIAAITVTQTVTFDNLTRALYLGSGGDLNVTFAGGETVKFVGADTGYHPLEVKAVQMGDTTADDIIALF